MIKRKKKISPFKIILTLILTISSIIIFLSIPVLFNYKSIESKIEKEFYSQFKINLEVLDKVNYSLLPRPHLIINKAKLDLDISNDKSSIIEISDIKVFLLINNIFSKKNIRIDSLEINNANINFKLNDVKKFRNHLFYKINRPIKIINSKFFYLDKKNNVILISPIYKLDYFIDNNNEVKKLKIKGNIFDIKFSSLWKRNYNFPKQTYNEIKFRKPNILIKNLFSFQNDKNFSGNSIINLLGEEININYLVKEDRIILKSNNEQKNHKFKINSIIELNPFYFDSQITLINTKFEFFTDYLLNYLSNYSKNLLGNLTGELSLNLKDIENEIIDSGKITLSINEKSLDISEASFEIKSVGTIKSNFKYYDDKGDLILSSNNVFELKNKKEFSKMFYLSKNNIKNINKIYFDLEKNIDTGEFLISNIQLNKLSSDNNLDKSYIIKNLKDFKKILKKILS
tara:strand:- start:1055 stop:2425 length:1371 start_codon:yes stop_codon:yes gene_type:complete